jgi:hypothetical protein
MEEAAAVRRAALDAVESVDPDHLLERIEHRIDAGSMAPGVLTILSAGALESGTDADAVRSRAAGVQLIYEGLRLTRTLATTEPWAATAGDGGRATMAMDPDRLDGFDAERSPAAATADVDILVADILVARGFYLLARTEAAGAAVAVVRSFGRDQTVSHETGDDSLDENLEADVFELAIVAGTTAAGGSAPPNCREFVRDLAAGNGELAPAVDLCGEDVRERLSGLVDSAANSTGNARTSADY